MPSRAKLKQCARDSLRESSPRIYLITLVYFLICYAAGFLKYIFGYRPGFPLVTVISAARLFGVQLSYRLRPIPFLSPLVFILIFAVLTLAGVEYSSVCLNVSRGRAPEPGGVYKSARGLGRLFKFLWLNILFDMFTLLWLLLFIVPGIIAVYRYSMAVFIMLDHPEYSAMDCIRMSAQMTNGYKRDLFLLDLSLLGWQLLSLIPFAGCYSLPYLRIAHANFYNNLPGYKRSMPLNDKKSRVS